MIYAEFIRRDRLMPFPVHRAHLRQDWTGEGDRLIANLGRTMKLGPEPTHLAWWRISGAQRLEEWEGFFRSPEGRLYAAESAAAHAMEFATAGLYDEVIGEDQAEAGPGLLLIEFFAADAWAQTDLGRWFRQRGRALGLEPAFVLQRIGMLAPDPGGMALWRLPDWHAALALSRALPPPDGPRRVAAGLYRTYPEDVP